MGQKKAHEKTFLKNPMRSYLIYVRTKSHTVPETTLH